MFCARTLSTLPEASRRPALSDQPRKRGDAIPTNRQLAPLHLVNLTSQFWVFIGVGCEERCPLAMGFRPTYTDSGSKVLADAIRDEKLSILRPSIAALSQPDLIVAERLSMGFRGVLFMWRTVADVAVQDEEGRAARRLAKHQQGLLDSINVVSVADAQNVPTVTQVSGAMSSVKAIRVFLRW